MMVNTAAPFSSPPEPARYSHCIIIYGKPIVKFLPMKFSFFHVIPRGKRGRLRRRTFRLFLREKRKETMIMSNREIVCKTEQEDNFHPY